MNYGFGDWILDAQRYELRRAGRVVPLRPKVFQVLRYLIEQRHRVVSKEELFERVWAGQFVGEATLSASILELRKVLGDAARAPRYLATRRGHGYRFVAAVRQLEAAARPGTGEAAPGPVSLAAPGSEAALPLAGDEGEHKTVTVLAGALAESAALRAGERAEDFHHLAHALWRQAQAVMAQYGGTLLSVSSVGFTALFGAPQAQEDHARRAVLAALDLRQALHAAGALPLCMGLCSGPVVVSQLPHDPARRDVAAGPALSQAAVLQRLAAPGQVLIGATTYHLVSQEAIVEAVTLPEAATALGGPVYALRGVPRRLGGVGGTRHRGTFVGRQCDLAFLQERLAYAQRGTGQLVSLLGEPGMGKSRLLDEFARSLAHRAVSCYVVHCLPYGRHVPYLPVRDLLQQCCGLESTAPRAQARLRQFLHADGLADNTAAALLASLLELSAPVAAANRLTPQARRLQTFALLSELLRRLSQRRPLVLAIENLHWIDATSEAWLQTFVPQLGTMAVLLLLTYRPEYAPPWPEASGSRLLLSPLLPPEGLQLVRALPEAAPLPDAVAQAFVARAGGNPFFLEELALGLGRAEPHAGVPAIPATVQSVLAARIDRLPAAEKGLLQAASVLASAFSARLLREVARMDEAALRRSLQVLQAAGFLEATADFPEPCYRFRHALVQEVAYGSLLDARRQALHAAAGEAFEALHADRLDAVVDQLSYHYARSAEAPKAVTYLVRAAAKAAHNSAHREALASLEAAERQSAHLPAARRWRLELRLQQAQALSFLGRFPDILTRLTPLQAEVERAGDAALASAYHFRLGMTQTYLGQYAAAGAQAARALTAAQRVASPALLGMAHYLLAFVGFSAGQSRQGVHHGQQAVAHLRSAGASHRHWLGLAHWAVGYSASMLGDYALARHALERARRLGQEGGDLRLQSLAGATAGWVQALCGQGKAGLQRARQALQQAPDPVATALAQLLLGATLLASRQPATASSLLQQALAGFTRLGFWQGVSRSAALLAQARLEAGDHTAARQQALAAWRTSRRIGYVYSLALARRLLGDLALHRGRLARAAAHLAATRRHCVAMRARHELARCHLALAVLAQRQEDSKALVAHLHRARRSFAACQVPGDLARAAALARAAGVALKRGLRQRGAAPGARVRRRGSAGE